MFCKYATRTIRLPGPRRDALTLPAKRARKAASEAPRCVWTHGRESSYCPRDSKVPQVPAWEPVAEGQLPPPTKVSPELADKLERLALVDFGSKEGIKCLEEAMRFADQLHVVNTDGVEALDSVLEDRVLHLRADAVTDGQCAEKLLSLARNTVEEYFIAPPGNIPLPKREERSAMLNHSEL